LFSSLLEVFSLGAIFPFVSLFINPSIFFDNEYFKPLIVYFEITKPVEIYFPITLGFFILTTTSYLLKLVLIYLRTNLSRIIVQEISSLIYWRVISEPYQFHSNNNSGDIISSLTHSFYISPKLILPILKIINSSLILGVALLGMFLYRPWTAFLIIGGISIFYLISGRLISKNLKNYSEIKNENYSLFIRLIQESLGAIKMIILNKTQFIFYKNFKVTISNYLKALSMVDFISQLPKMFFEYLVILIIIIITYNYSGVEKITVLVPSIITIVIAIQKLLPEFNVLYQNFVNIKSNKAIIESVINTLSINDKFPWKAKQAYQKIKFNKTVILKDIKFKYYENEKAIFTDMNLTIQKGKIIGIVGESGSGKSTLIDLLSGIISPNSGRIIVDGVDINLKNIQGWKDNISVVSQNIFLFDSTIENNITFNNTEGEIDYEKLNQVCRIAELTDFIDNQPNGYQSKIGEKGVRISGGQKQRIAIARALYNRSEVLILDEATSALDENTERKVMKNIIDYSQNLTLIIIAHRLTTLKQCNKIFKVETNGLKVFNGYTDLIKSEKNE
ncbi:ABC transporter ATP-binding protein/permease, partial [Flavobacteriaceae bacterium]|nr:ABC transporter ATP-binding protein/permease [Flavobacteriaceae bacterium]